MLLALITALLTVIADIMSKAWIAARYELYYTEELIPGILNITNIANDGIAFGWLDNARWLFMLATAVIILVLLYFSVFVKGYHKIVYLCAGAVLGGGLGNFIDRIFTLGKYDKAQCVVDFIDFCAFPELWKWTFNVADVAVCIGVGIFALYLIILDKKCFENGMKSVVFEEKKNGGNKTDE